MGTFRNGRVTENKCEVRALRLPDKSRKALAKQANAIAFRQLREHGLTAPRIERLVAAGTLRPLTGRVLTTLRGDVGRDTQRWVAMLSAGPTARLTGLSALAVHDVLERDLGGPVYVVVECGSPRSAPGLICRRTKAFDEDDLTTVDDYPTVTVSRALCSAAEFAEADKLAELMDRAVMLGRYDATRLETLIGKRTNLPGRGQLLEAMATLDASSGHFRSVFELKTKRLIEQSKRIGLPVVNVIVEGYRPDMRWINTAAIVECDGRDYHRSPAQILADAEREEILIALGFSILRLRWADVVYAPERTLARIEEFVLAHAAPPVPVTR